MSPQTIKKRKSYQRKAYKHTDTVLQLLRPLYYRGCAPQDALLHGLKKSAYHDYKNMMEFLYNRQLEVDTIGRKPVARFRKSTFETSYNFLLNIYRMKSCTENDILYTVAIVSVLSKEASGLTEAKLTGEALEIVDAINIVGDGASPTCVRKIKELCEYGYLERDHTTKRYRLANNPLALLQREQLQRLADYSILMSCIISPSVPGMYLHNTTTQILRDHAVIKAAEQMPPNKNIIDILKEQIANGYRSPFLFKHLQMGKVLEDEKVWLILQAIERQELICYRKGTEEFCIQPYKIITDQAYGRQYVFGLSVPQNSESHDTTQPPHPILERIDKIEKIQTISQALPQISKEQLAAAYQAQMRYNVIGVSFAKSKPDCGTLLYDIASEEIVLKKFPEAKPLAYSDTQRIIKIQINSLKQLKPWLRLHIGKITLLESSDATAADMQSEMREWREMYGIN